MTIDEIKKQYAINRLMDAKDGYKEFLADEVIDIAIEAIKQTMWTPVSEELPKENETVIASTKYGVYPEAKYTKEKGWEWAYESGADYWVELEYVMAWMPLPEPYKTESEE